MKPTPRLVTALCLALAGTMSPLLAQETYQKPPEAILKTMHADLPAQPLVNPTGDRMILGTMLRYPSIRELAQPFLRLAGVRVTPGNHSVHGTGFYVSYQLTDLSTGQLIPVKVPQDARLSYPMWSPDGKHFVFTNDTSKGVELWIGDGTSGAVRKLKNVQVNRVLGRTASWLPDNRTIVTRVVNAASGPAPDPSVDITGPSIQQSVGNATASSTYEARDVLKNPQDEKLFAYYAESQIVAIDTTTGKIKRLGKPALYTRSQLSPDGQHLLVETLHKPFSYQTTYDRFPSEIDVWNLEGKSVAHLASSPLADHVPIRGVEEGPRNFQWRANEPATLIYVEALDGGDSKKNVPEHDRIMMVRAPFKQPAQEIYRAEKRIQYLQFGEKKDFTLVYEMDVFKSRMKTFIADIDGNPTSKRVLWDMSVDDNYAFPGQPVERAQPNGFELVQQNGDLIYLSGEGSSPEGDRPFLDALNIKTLKTDRLFHSDKDHLEHFISWLNKGSKEFVTRRESAQDYPNYFVHGLESTAVKTLTNFPDPLPELRGITKKIVTYKRDDGVDLSFTLYLPPNYKAGTRLPTVMWAYPLDFSEASVAGQVTGSTQEYTLPGWPLQLFFLQAGYAVIDNPSLPVIGDAKKIYDTYMEQLISGAKAAVDKAVELGVTDRDRIGVMGHSHGGLMTVNLLAHTDLFRAGIARSGAYNRSLTPFGFQSETRTVWEAPEVYRKVSPFFVADKIKKPLLLIHGADDANPGTTPLQSDKLFEAVRAHGGTVRLVKLPFESHGYRAQESVEHTVWESLQWFDTYVKSPEQRDLKQAAAFQTAK